MDVHRNFVSPKNLLEYLMLQSLCYIPVGFHHTLHFSSFSFLIYSLCRFFIGTSVSTFSFRIHEEREILGFNPKTTYNRFCGDTEKECEQPTHWKIVY